MDFKSKMSGVGFCQPPAKFRYPKGVSGNPAGRPKKKPALNDAIERELSQSVTFTENGRRQSLTKAQIIAKQVTNAATKGDYKSMKLLIESLDKRSRLEALLESRRGWEPEYPQFTPEENRKRLNELLEKGGYVQVVNDPPSGALEILSPKQEKTERQHLEND